MPGHYILKLNNRCNMNCLFCADSKKTRELPDPNFDIVIENLNQNRKKFDSLIITGGEPTIYGRLFETIKYAKDICGYNRINLATNGLLLSYKNFINKLIENGVDSFQISYFALDRKKYDAVSGVRNSFEYVNKGIRNVIKKNKEVRINLVINKLNYRDLPDIVEHLIRLDVNSITFAFMNPAGESVRNGKSILAIPFREIMPFIKMSFDNVTKLGYDNLYIENFPPCIAKDYIEKISDLYKPEENKDYYNSSKDKLGQCKECFYQSICSGIWTAYLKQFGGGEIKPVQLRKITKDNKNIFKKEFGWDIPRSFRWVFEMAGIELGIKKASILYLEKKEIPHFIRKFKERGYDYEISEFSYLIKDELIQRVNSSTREGNHSLYISKDRKICQRLKYLDYYHQFKIKEPKGTSSREAFFEIGGILGYPKCCSQFLLSCHDDNRYENIFGESGRQYQDDTIYKILALKNSPKVLYQLNNFSNSYPRYFNFFVCRYDCSEALSIVNKLLDYIKSEYLSAYKNLLRDLKNPFIFFSACRIIYLINATKKEDKIHYSECFAQRELIRELGVQKKNKFKDMIDMFLCGNSFKINDNGIFVYKDNNFTQLIKKRNWYDGVFIEFN